MAFNTPAVADALVTLLQGLTSMATATVQKGAPMSVGTRRAAYVTAGAQRPEPKAGGMTMNDSRFFIDLAYRLDGDESAAETWLMTVIDEFLAAISADLTLGGTVSNVEIDMGMSEEPEYRERGAKEYREYPIVLTVRQYGSYVVNP